MPRILLVVDDSELRMRLAGQLRRAQLDVITACNEVEALYAIEAASFRRRHTELALVITDTPNANGLGLSAVLGLSRRRVPMLPIPAIHTQSDRAQYGVEIDDVVELAKTITRYGRLGRA